MYLLCVCMVILSVIVKIFSLFGEVLSVFLKSTEHVCVYTDTLRATSLEPVTGEINNMDDFVPVPCSVVKP